jgi:hypothetical protein
MTSLAAPKNQYLVAPRIDVWLLGGASLVLWALLTVGDEVTIVRPFLEKTSAEAYFWALALFSYPHFAASQWMCYSRGSSFLKRNWFELFAVPAALFVALGCVYANYATIGPSALRFFLTAFLLLSGWHFAMQAFGCTVISSYYDGVKLRNDQRTALKASLGGLWIYTFLSRFESPDDRVVGGVEIYFVKLPRWVYGGLGVFLVGATLWAAYLLVLEPWRKTGTRPSGRSMVAWLSLFFWWLPAIRSPEFFLYGVPLFHGVQHYAFTYRFERARGATSIKVFLLAAGLIGFGFMAHRTIPTLLDHSSVSPSPNYFFLCFTFLINIHHYFLDRANFRMSEPETRRLLLGVPSAPATAAPYVPAALPREAVG